jgi:hypothetical protein
MWHERICIEFDRSAMCNHSQTSTLLIITELKEEKADDEE